MKIVNSDLGVQSWSFRGIGGNEAIVEALKELGLSTLEVAGIHTNLDNCEDVLKLYTDNGIALSALGVEGIKNDEAQARKAFDLARGLGVKVLSIDPDPDAIELIEKLSAEYGIKTAIHNHGREHRYGNIEQLKAIFDVSTPNIGLYLDAAWAMDSGTDPRDYISAFGDRLYGVHLKDFVLHAGEEPEEVIIGTGDLPLSEILNVLKAMNYQGVLSIEYEEKEENPVSDIAECIKNISAVAP